MRHNPNEEGTSCDFEQHALKMQAYQGIIVQFYPNYRPGPSGNEGLPCTATVPTSMPFEAIQRTRISPNPNAGSFELYYKLENTHGSSFLIYNLFGQEVYRDFLPDTDGSVHLNLATLPNGTYFYVIPSGSGSLSGKIVIEKG